MKIVIAVSFILLTPSIFSAQNISTAEDRAALFDYIYQRTLERESFSPIKEKTLGVDVKEAMLACRNDVINAATDQDLFFALTKLSAARKDRHLRVNPVKGGLKLPEVSRTAAPIQFMPDFGVSGQYFLFVSNYTKDIGQHVLSGPEPSIGDKVIAINGRPFESYFEDAEPYLRYSSINNLWRRFAFNLPIRTSGYLPESFYGDRFEVELENAAGKTYLLSIPYRPEEDLEWQYDHQFNYPGFELAFKKQSYHLYLPQDTTNKVLLLWWYGFRENLIQDMDHLVEYAEENGMLDWDIIIDATGSRGGSRGAYALQKLVSKPFKTTFGNLRLSDITLDFIHEMNQKYIRKSLLDGGVPENVGSGEWVIDWLNNEVIKGLAAGQQYSNNVPFKNAHLPKFSDGIIRPADKHFTGRLVCLFDPWGGSHLDQFAAMVNDNGLGHTIGMPTGGYSNTWEWEETLHFPISGQPVAEFMWSIGHTIRPNGEILEGNAAMVDDYLPLTRANFMAYLPELLERGIKWLKDNKKRLAKP